MSREEMKSDLPSDAALHGTVEAFELQHAIIRTTDDQRLLVDRMHLPADLRVGETVTITIATKRGEEDQQKKMARTLLNEILNPEP